MNDEIKTVQNVARRIRVTNRLEHFYEYKNRNNLLMSLIELNSFSVHFNLYINLKSLIMVVNVLILSLHYYLRYY